MHKIDGNGHVNGTFVHENPETGQAPTVLTADWHNAVQSELVNTIQAADLVLNKADNSQLKQAIIELINKAFSAVEGHGNGLNADTVDGKHAADFVLNASAAGNGQSWQDVLSSRGLGVEYRNETSKPIFVIVDFSAPTENPGGHVTLIIDGDFITTEFAANSKSRGKFYFPVYPSETYEIRLSAGSVSLDSWKERR